jgi:hypothetical protein
MASPTETGGANNVTQLSDFNPAGTNLGQSATDLISFYNVTPIAQPTAPGDIATQLINLGLIASGTYAGAQGWGTASSSASSLSSNTPISNTGVTKLSSSASITYYLTNPTLGCQKFFFSDYANNTSAIAITINVNATASTGLPAGSTLVFINAPTASSVGTTASSFGAFVVTNTSMSWGASIQLYGASSKEWVVMNQNTSLWSYTT